MKSLTLALLGTLAAGAASAGTLVYTAPEVTMIEEAAPMGGSGAWLIPLVILGVLVLALTSTDDTAPVEEAL